MSGYNAGDWKPGDVAMLTLSSRSGLQYPGMRLAGIAEKRWSYPWLLADGGIGHSAITEARRLVVIDPENREQVERLFDAIFMSAFRKGVQRNDINKDYVQAALREIASPTKPEEPTGLGAVVRYDDSPWVSLSKHRWAEVPTDESVQSRLWYWDEFPADVEVVREGWSE